MGHESVPLKLTLMPTSTLNANLYCYPSTKYNFDSTLKGEGELHLRRARARVVRSSTLYRGRVGIATTVRVYVCKSRTR